MILDLAVTTVVNGDLLLAEIGGVSTNDRRLSDARPPLPHQHLMSDVIGLADALLALTEALATAVASAGSGEVLDRLLTDGADVLVGASGDVLWR